MKKVLVLVLLVMLLPALVACTASGGESSSVAATEIPAPVEATLPATAEQPTPTSPAAMDPDADEAAVPAELAIGALGDLTYQGILDMPITLNGGRFGGEPAVEGSAGHPRVTLLPEPTAYGDLNGDGRPDSAVMLAAESGGVPEFPLPRDRLGASGKTAVAWAGCSAMPPALARLQARLDERLRAAGFVLERRPFAAHVTRAPRIKDPPGDGPGDPVPWRAAGCRPPWPVWMPKSSPAPSPPRPRCRRCWRTRRFG